MIRPTKAQLESERQAAYAKIDRLSQALSQIREVISIPRCLQIAKEVLAEEPDLTGPELLAVFISRIWWIDVSAKELSENNDEDKA